MHRDRHSSAKGKRSARNAGPGLGAGIALLACVALAGCGTVQVTDHGVLEPLAGVDLDLFVIARTTSSWERAARVIDLPLSLVADAALFPITFTAADP